MQPDPPVLTRVICTLFSTFAHVGIFGVFVIAAHRTPADLGTPGPVAPHGAIDVGLVDVRAEPAGATPGSGPVTTHAPAHATSQGHAATHGVTDAPMHALGTSMPREGDWVGTYECIGQTYGLAIHIEHVHGDTFRVVGSATSPTGIHGTYAQHGTRDASGEARFVPDGWVGPPMRDHYLTGMKGRFDGDSFSGTLDASQCGAVSLHRTTS